MQPHRWRSAGWSTLFIGIAIPFWMAGTYAGLYWTSHCRAGFPRFTTAPLMASCAAPDQTESIVGWALTLLTLACLVAAPILAIVATSTATTRVDRVRGLLLAASIVVVLSLVLLVAATDPFPTGLWPASGYGVVAATDPFLTGVWPASGYGVLLGTVVGLFALLVCRITAAVIAALVGRARPAENAR